MLCKYEYTPITLYMCELQNSQQKKVELGRCGTFPYRISIYPALLNQNLHPRLCDAEMYCVPRARQTQLRGQTVGQAMYVSYQSGHVLHRFDEYAIGTP
jgi:hypothetical protein